MNIKNISALGVKLQAIGVENGTSALLKRICFRPEQFSLERRLNKGKDAINIHLFFQKSAGSEEYNLLHYDVALISEVNLAGYSINGVEITILDKEMTSINWKEAFNPEINKEVPLENEEAWKQEAQIESIVDKLRKLEEVEEGEVTASLLKQRHWPHPTMASLLGIMVVTKNKVDISQRFYAQDADSLISVDEAVRFLQNKRLEKQLQIGKKKLPDSSAESKNSEGRSDKTLSTSRNGRISKKNRKAKTIRTISK